MSQPVFLVFNPLPDVRLSSNFTRLIYKNLTAGKKFSAKSDNYEAQFCIFDFFSRPEGKFLKEIFFIKISKGKIPKFDHGAPEKILYILR